MYVRGRDRDRRASCGDSMVDLFLPFLTFHNTLITSECTAYNNTVRICTVNRTVVAAIQRPRNSVFDYCTTTAAEYSHYLPVIDGDTPSLDTTQKRQQTVHCPHRS